MAQMEEEKRQDWPNFASVSFRQLPRPVGRGGFVNFGIYLLDSVGNFAHGRRGEWNYEENGAKMPQMEETRAGMAKFRPTASVSFRG